MNDTDIQSSYDLKPENKTTRRTNIGAKGQTAENAYTCTRLRNGVDDAVKMVDIERLTEDEWAECCRDPQDRLNRKSHRSRGHHRDLQIHHSG